MYVPTNNFRFDDSRSQALAFGLRSIPNPQPRPFQIESSAVLRCQTNSKEHAELSELHLLWPTIQGQRKNRMSVCRQGGQELRYLIKGCCRMKTNTIS